MEDKAHITWNTKGYIENGKPIRIALVEHDENGEPVEVDHVDVQPEKYFPRHIWRKLLAHSFERLALARVSQYSKMGGSIERFRQIKTNLLPMWAQGIWRYRKRSTRLEIQAIAEVFGRRFDMISDRAKEEPEEFEALLQREDVQSKIRELQQETVSLKDLLKSPVNGSK